MLAKRIFDIMVAIALLMAVWPLCLAIALGIRMSSPGPILYRGLRTGRYGRPFHILKFRTMIVDAEKVGGGTTALDDPRIFSFGQFLRRFKLDELPQLWNVLLGEMSLVGPRPELPIYTARYTPEEQEILAVPPGITDFSSVRFSALDEIVGHGDADRTFEEKVLPEKNRLRLAYVRTRSFWVDLKILAMTVACILHKMLH